MEYRKYEELDKAVSKEIMAEFKDEPIDTVCPHCKGEEPLKSECEDCNGEGHYLLTY